MTLEVVLLHDGVHWDEKWEDADKWTISSDPDILKVQNVLERSDHDGMPVEVETLRVYNMDYVVEFGFVD